jgi:hypothetical protein
VRRVRVEGIDIRAARLAQILDMLDMFVLLAAFALRL